MLLSPFIKPETKSETAYNHYGMLGTIEGIFGLPRLGCAAGTPTFGSDVFNEKGYSGPSAEAERACYVPPVKVETVTKTESKSESPKTSTPKCVATTISKSAHGKLGSNKVFKAPTVTRSHGVAKLGLDTVHAAKLKVTVRSKGKSRTLASRSVAACSDYSFKLPSGHGTLTIVATVGRATQTASKSF